MGGISNDIFEKLVAEAIKARKKASDKNLKKDVKYSDEKLKTDVKKSEGRLGDFLAKLDVYNYDYKDEKHGEGRQTSIMAQDLEKSEIGKKAIIETPEGKMVDYGSLLPAMLSANVDANKRIMKLEDALKGRRKK